MDAKAHRYAGVFLVALQKRDDAIALALLDQRHVTTHSVCIFEKDGGLTATPVIFLAIQYAREQVVRALVRLGADIDAFYPIDADGVAIDGIAITPTGSAIRDGDAPSLALCHRLGANMSVVRRQSSVVLSAVSAAINSGVQQPVCLTYLLDNVYPGRPVVLSRDEMASVCASASFTGGGRKAYFEVLETRGFDFKSMSIELLSDFQYESDAPGSGASFADLLLVNVRSGGDAALLRYLVKDLGMVSTAGRLDVSKGLLDDLVPTPVPELVGAWSKYECAACDSVGLTKMCAGCRAVRYCSKECGTRHWKTGGHRAKCKEQQRVAALTTSSSVGGSTGPAGSTR